jgi:hypothetical protein
MTKTPGRRRGGQPGNQNARSHGYYSKVLTSGQQKLLPTLSAMRGLDREVEIARAKVISILALDPANTKVLLRALGTLRHLARDQETIDRHLREQAERATEAFDQFLDRLDKDE